MGLTAASTVADDDWAMLAPPWQACFEEAWSSFAAGAIPVGAVVTDAEGRVLSRGRNGVGAHAGRLGNHPLAHAELDALFGVGDDALRDGALYALLEPCPACLGGFYVSGLRRLHVGAREPWSGSLDLIGATPYMRLKRLAVTAFADPVLEAVVQTLQMAERVRRYPEVVDAGQDRFTDRWRQVAPAVVAFGIASWQDGWLARAAADGAPAGVVYAALARRVRAAGLDRPTAPRHEATGQQEKTA